MASQNWVDIGSGHGMVPWWHQGIAWTNIGILSTGKWCFSSTDKLHILSKLFLGPSMMNILEKWPHDIDNPFVLVGTDVF